MWIKKRKNLARKIFKHSLLIIGLLDSITNIVFCLRQSGCQFLTKKPEPNVSPDSPFKAKTLQSKIQEIEYQENLSHKMHMINCDTY